ncbi:E3 ubiquitin-protein ligase TRIM45-like [Magallana gigas]|uniref:E3 ubiquitin-protein ligase TRIM45-like n=1 Tax=Magallana gigas TaxID=29159 RepID=UPI0033419FC6
MAKANVDNQIQFNILTVCPICFKKFNIPRILPCSHTFCHACLDSHIKSSCEKSTPLGFTCPLCRDFIPAPGVVGQYAFDKWSELIPTNKFIASLLVKCNDLLPSTILCDLCKIDGNAEIAVNWCQDCESTYCETCLNTHRKLNPVLKHKIVSLNDATNAVGLIECTPKFCTSHPKCKIDLFCRDHQMSSCALCVLLLHRTCKHIGPIEEEAADSDKTKLRAIGLLKKMTRACDEFEKIIEIEKLNLLEIDENVDLCTGMIRNSYEKCIKHLNDVKERQLNQLAKMSKNGKQKLESSIQNYENRKVYLKKCQKTLEGALECEDYTQTLLWYSLIKENVGEIQKMKFQKLKLDLKYIGCDTKISEIENFKEFGDLKLQEKVSSFPEVTDFFPNRLRGIRTWQIPPSDIKAGAFLPNGVLILTDYNCALFSEDGHFQKELKFSASLWGMHYDQEMEVLYLTIPVKKEIKMINLNTFSEIKTFHTKLPARKMTKVNGRFFTIGTKWLCTLNNDFELVNETFLEDDSDDIASDLSGNIIYSCYKKNTVTKKNDKNEIMFVYQHESLKAPYGLAADPVGNIYVCGRRSNNIHIISETGQTLGILNGFVRPQFIAFQENSFKFFVIERENVRICELI